MDRTATILLVVAGGVAFYAAVQYGWGRYFSQPRPFDHGGMTFLWVPDEGAKLSFFRRHWKYGSIHYEDGSPVTDPRLHDEVLAAWLAMNRRRGEVSRAP